MHDQTSAADPFMVLRASDRCCSLSDSPDSSRNMHVFHARHNTRCLLRGASCNLLKSARLSRRTDAGLSVAFSTSRSIRWDSCGLKLSLLFVSVDRCKAVSCLCRKTTPRVTRNKIKSVLNQMNANGSIHRAAGSPSLVGGGGLGRETARRDGTHSTLD